MLTSANTGSTRVFGVTCRLRTRSTHALIWGFPRGRATPARDTVDMTDATPMQIQVTIDAARAHHLADWWAETLGWEVEPQDEGFIRSMIEQGFATEADTETHRGALVWRGTTAINSPDGPRILFQDVPEEKAGKNRMHLDLRPPEGVDLDELRTELESRGARRIGSGQQGPHSWVVFADPEGNEFCL